MKVLGVYYGHNSTALLFEDGNIIDCISEERLTGIKNQTGIPKKSIKYILEKNKITASDLDVVAIPVKISAPIYASEDNKKTPFISFLNTIYNSVPVIKNTFGFVSFYNPNLRGVGRFFYKFFSQTIGAYSAENERKILADFLQIPFSKIQAYDHHTSHAYSAYYSSPYNNEKCLVLTLDAEGDGICASVNIFDGTKFECLSRTHADNSLGLMYAAVTQHLCMKVGEHEYKVMGLAPYAKEYAISGVYEKVKDLFSLGGKDGLEIASKFDMRQMPRYLREELGCVRFDVMAGVFQKLLEEVALKWVENAVDVTGIHTLCVAGGVFMNVKLNQRIHESKKIDRVFYLPSCGDESSPIGACYIAYLANLSQKTPTIKPLQTLYWGNSYTNDEIKTFLDSKNATQKYKVSFIQNIEEEIAKLISENKIVGRMSGRMEFGARALGNRSILANPANVDIVNVINEQVKNRDFWMPFTPSILEERINDYIVNPKHVFAPYMIVTFNTSNLARKELKAALHPYDLTARPQLVKESWNPGYYKIIKSFEKLTGIGAVLNTSFNLHGFPIVMGPEEAYYAFENSGLQYIALENYLVSK
ncbi:MAG TPA: carbamoyltransferase C-terminal domain-containing protein [Candidatus Saccharimonadales bacterium]|nr:carbamoyltransferase C-terminal domain-containing protein [Candidatus Saccharimonadales bacterium]